MSGTPVEIRMSSAAPDQPMHSANQPAHGDATAEPRWRPIAAIDRRVAGVLVEKAKTTPDAYPMTLNAIRTGANQKNNRYPLMEVEAEDVQEALDRLRAAGAVGEVQGSGRAAKYRHYLYDWLGVDKVELAVMAELLLRGTQTEGELRGRAARMEPIADVAALRPVLASLQAKGLVISLTPEGRGHVVTHALYEPRELEKLQREFQHVRVSSAEAADEEERASSAAPTPSSSRPSHAAPPVTGGHASPAESAALETLRSQVAEMQVELARLRKEVDDLWAQFR